MVSGRPMNQSASLARISLSVASQTASQTAPGSIRTLDQAVRHAGGASACIGSIRATREHTAARGSDVQGIGMLR